MDSRRGAWSSRRETSSHGAAEPRRQLVPRQSLSTSKRQVPEQFLVLIDCASESEQVRLLTRFQAEGLRCRALIS
jgi:hypothetical protein